MLYVIVLFLSCYNNYVPFAKGLHSQNSKKLTIHGDDSFLARMLITFTTGSHKKGMKPAGGKLFTHFSFWENGAAKENAKMTKTWKKMHVVHFDERIVIFFVPIFSFENIHKQV